MEPGDFTELAQNYHHRAGYSLDVLRMILGLVRSPSTSSFLVADVGAGTGKLTENLLTLGLRCVAVEPNDAMRSEGIQYTSRFTVQWRKGSGEDTGLEAGSVDWLLMGSSFHWVDLTRGLTEFHRVIKPGGYFTALWNPRDLQRSSFHLALEEKIHQLVPQLKRRSSGSDSYTADLPQRLTSTGQFAPPIFVESYDELVMSRERYMGAWRSVNDIQAQAGPECWERVLKCIEEHCGDRATITVPYRTRAWTTQRLPNQS